MPLRGYKLFNTACVIQQCLARPSDFGDSNKVACLMVFNTHEKRNTILKNVYNSVFTGTYISFYSARNVLYN